ncbi:MAG: SoxR reducing system RseC family protein [Halothiobacillus sp.]
MNLPPIEPIKPLKEAPVVGSVDFAIERLAQWDEQSGAVSEASDQTDAFIREQGVVVALVEGGVVVETFRQTGCQSCASRGGCGINLMQKALNRKQHQVRVSTQLPLRVGERVQLVLPASALVQASLLMYVLPLLGLMLGALAGQMLFATNSASILGGALGFFAALLGLSRRQKGLFANGRYAPRVELANS